MVAPYGISALVVVSADHRNEEIILVQNPSLSIPSKKKELDFDEIVKIVGSSPSKLRESLHQVGLHRS